MWADRRELRARFERLVASWTTNPRSGLYLMWADLGAGKTHALRFIEGLGRKRNPPSLAIYCDVPDTAVDFRSLYIQAATRLSEEALSEAIYKHRQTEGEAGWLSSSVLRGDRTTPRILWTIAEAGASAQGDLARRWLRGERLGARDLALLGATGWIKTSDDAIRTLTTIARLLSRSKHYSRVILMFDEFQRIGQVSQKRVKDINAGIASVFNGCPEGLAIILSYSFGAPENIRYMTTGEVLSRVGENYHLPVLTVNDSGVFLSDLIAHHSTDGQQRVFEALAMKRLIEKLREDSHDRITPRKLMQVAGAVFDSAVADGEAFPITASVAERLYRAPVEDILQAELEH